ncbi:LpqB family beta-propeller domain-containing protein [Kitasatospora indigofera]|uniref:LpqB family beta-propeller domain-containing protein n=1 Tax=Kitasatospora indigofera TaxID=67307 RepID=UPI00167D1F9C|nr:LpqB family beta-propeller domain-containing protein [Kitasatospora indigofera]
MRRTSSRSADPRRAATAGAVLASLLLGGCAAMPDSGPVSKVEFSQGAADKNLQVRVFPVAPYKGEEPRRLLAGFLDASIADEEGYDTAKKYLTEGAHSRWNPEAGITVLAGDPTYSGGQEVKEGDTTAALTASGTQVAKIDARHTYRYADGETKAEFTFVKENGEWRIDRLPDGLLVNQTNFRNSYRQFSRFFYTGADPSLPTAREVLVADPIYLRRRIDPLAAAAKALAGGPSEWLAPVVSTTLEGVSVKQVTVDDSKVARVEVEGSDLGGRPQFCQRMAAQFFFTLADQGKGQIDRLELRSGSGSCSTSRSLAEQVAPGSLAGGSTATRQYYQRHETGQLMTAADQGEGTPVPGELGKVPPPGRAPLGTIAVRRDGQRAAVVSGDGQQLFTVNITDGSALGQAVLTSAGHPARPEDGLASPSWDGRGDLWVVDRAAPTPRVNMIRETRTVTVPVDDLGGRTVQSLKVSSDGVRVALVLKDETGARSMALGVVTHTGTPGAQQVRITGLRTVAPLLAEVASVSWADTDQLLVLGKEKDRLQQLYYISTDGSQSTEAPLQGGEGMATVAASEGRENGSVPPVLAVQTTESKIYRLTGNQWRELVLPYTASSFIYPG